MRLDLRVAEILGVSRNRAQFFVENWLVWVDGVRQLKVSHDTALESMIRIDEDPQLHYVSRSAAKLEGFLLFLGSRDLLPTISRVRALDVGASTGGFTQILLARWALSVVALDVGTDQLHPSLRWDSRIESLEQTDIRTWDSQEKFSLIVVDVSFISLRLVLDSIVSHLVDNGRVILLFKPQFEVTPTDLTRSGVPRSEALRLRALEEFRVYLASQSISILAEAESTLHGEAGNREVLFLIQKGE